MSLLKEESKFFSGLVRILLHPGVPPPHAKWVFFLLIGSCMAVLLMNLVVAKDPDAFFGEADPGTYLSFAYLMISGAACFAVCRTLAKNNEDWRWVRWLLLVFILAAAVLFVAAVVMLALGDSWHNSRTYFFKWKRFGRHFDYPMWGLVIYWAGLCWILRRCRFCRFWFALGGLLWFAALDDLLEFHEHSAQRVSKEWLGLPKDHIVAFHMNDVFVVLYGLAAAVLVWWNRHEIARLPWMIFAMLLAVSCFIGTVVADFSHWGWWQEESLKVLAGVSIFAAVIIAHMEIVRDLSRGPR